MTTWTNGSVATPRRVLIRGTWSDRKLARNVSLAQSPRSLWMAICTGIASRKSTGHTTKAEAVRRADPVASHGGRTLADLRSASAMASQPMWSEDEPILPPHLYGRSHSRLSAPLHPGSPSPPSQRHAEPHPQDAWLSTSATGRGFNLPMTNVSESVLPSSIGS